MLVPCSPLDSERDVESAGATEEVPAWQVSASAEAASTALLDKLPEVELELVVPGLVRHLVLQEPLAARKVTKAAGFVADERPPFRELCARPAWEGGRQRSIRRGPLHIDVAEGVSSDPALLAALLQSRKVLVAESLRPLDLAGLATNPPEVVDLSAWALPRDVFDPAMVGPTETPQQGVERLGRRAMLTGVGLVALAGASFAWQDAVVAIGGGDDEELYVGPRYG